MSCISTASYWCLFSLFSNLRLLVFWFIIFFFWVVKRFYKRPETDIENSTYQGPISPHIGLSILQFILTEKGKVDKSFVFVRIDIRVRTKELFPSPEIIYLGFINPLMFEDFSLGSGPLRAVWFLGMITSCGIWSYHRRLIPDEQKKGGKNQAWAWKSLLCLGAGSDRIQKKNSPY